MSSEQAHIRHGRGAVRPYLYGHLDLPEMLQRAFGLVEVERLPVGKGFHIEAQIGDSMLVLEVCDPPHLGGTRASIYVYVPDVDGAYRRALDSGATSVAALEDKPYEERAGGVKDRFGNIWYIATYKRAAK